MDTNLHLQWTGDPYFDVGLATLLAFSEKDDPRLLTDDDLERAAQWVLENYTRDPLKSFLTVAFTTNNWFAAPSMKKKKEEDKRERSERHVFGWRRAPRRADLECVFTGSPALGVALSDSLLPGRAGRAQVPLAQGDKNINFYAGGIPGLPISGEALLCVQLMPMGCAKIGGRLLLVHASAPEITLGFVRAFLAANREAVQLAQAAGEKKLPESRYGLGTLLVTTLIRLVDDAAQSQSKSTPFSLTAYHFTNSGRSPDIEVYHLPLGVTSFVRRARAAHLRPAWERVVKAAESQSVKPQKGTKSKAADKVVRNPFYEDLIRLPEQSRAFLRRYLVAPALDLRSVSESAPSLWSLVEVFLQEVENMDQDRIRDIRVVADRIASYIQAQNDRRLFQALYSATGYRELRNALIKANLIALRLTGQPLISFEEFISVYEIGEESPQPDWRLAHDLMLLRLMEQLASWLRGHREVIEVLEPEQTEALSAE